MFIKIMKDNEIIGLLLSKIKRNNLDFIFQTQQFREFAIEYNRCYVVSLQGVTEPKTKEFFLSVLRKFKSFILGWEARTSLLLFF